MKTLIPINEDIPDIGPIGCVERWKNPGPDERKQMFSLVEEVFYCFVSPSNSPCRL